MTTQDLYEQLFRAYSQQQQQQAYTYSSYAGTSPSRLDETDKKLLKQIKQDAVEYFEPLGIKVGTGWERQRLSKEQKERVVEFIKNRLKFYEKEGFLA